MSVLCYSPKICEYMYLVFLFWLKFACHPMVFPLTQLFKTNNFGLDNSRILYTPDKFATPVNLADETLEKSSGWIKVLVCEGLGGVERQGARCEPSMLGGRVDKMLSHNIVRVSRW